MRKTWFMLGLLALVASTACAGGIDRSGQGLGPLFESGNYIETSIYHVSPRVKGTDLLGGSTGNVTGNYLSPSLSLKFDVSPKLSVALIAEQTYGADLLYGSGSLLLGGTMVNAKGYSALGMARYRLNEHVSVHGGLRVQNASASVRLQGLAYGALSGYQARLNADTAVTPMLGVALEKPDIAMRLALTYHGAGRHKLDTTETAPLAYLNGTSTTAISTPRAVNVDFQTGVTKNTLLFAHLRWVNWSEFRVDPARFVAVTGEGLIDLADTRTWTLGIARQFSDRWAGALSLSHEGRGAPMNSPLSPVNGRRGVMLAAIYTQDRLKITTGVSYVKLGDAVLETGTPDVQRATMRGNALVGVGIKAGWSF